MRFSITLLVTALAASAAAANPLMDTPILDGIFHKRQVVGTGATTSSSSAETSSSTSDTTITSESTSTRTSTSTSDGTPTTITSSTTSSTTITSAAPTSAPGSSSGGGGGGSGSSSEETSSTENTSLTTYTTPLVATSTRLSTTVIQSTGADGQVSLVTSTSSEVFASTTGFATIVSTPTLQASSDNGGSGLSSSSKKIIGGVVGGVGGAILLGGIALVLWRMYGRRQHSDNYDDVHSGDTAIAENKPASSSGIADDESHLDRYTQQGRPNAAANF